MSEYRIKVEPSGHSFHVLEHETLLDAALRSGLNVDFNCSSGSCGECRAKLIEGELGEDDFHEFHFSEADKAQGMFLLCTSHAASDLVIEAGEARSPHDIPRQQITTKVHKLEEAGDRLRILQLKTPRTHPLRFLAGQHVELSLPDVGCVDASIASCPCNGQQLQFHIPFNLNNPFVVRLFEGLRHGTEIGIDGPFGEMTLDDDSKRPLLMVAQDHGLAPMKSLVEHAINLDLTQPIRVLWMAREGEHYLENICRSWGEALDDYRYHPLVRGEDEGDEAQVGHIMAVIADEIENLAEWDIYWAGSDAFNHILQARLVAAGAQTERVFFPSRRLSPHTSQQIASG